MRKTELEVISRLIGRRYPGGVTAPGGGALRDVIGGRVHKVCLMLEREGLGKTEEFHGIAFVFRTTDELARIREAGQ